MDGGQDDTVFFRLSDHSWGRQSKCLKCLESLASLGCILESHWVTDYLMFLRFCQIFRVCSGYVQSMFTEHCSEYVQSMFRVCSGYVSFHSLAHLVCEFLAFSIIPHACYCILIYKILTPLSQRLYQRLVIFLAAGELASAAASSNLATTSFRTSTPSSSTYGDSDDNAMENLSRPHLKHLLLNSCLFFQHQPGHHLGLHLSK